MKHIFIVLIFFTSLFAQHEIFNKKNIFTVKIKNQDFNSLLVNLSDEILHEGFVIVHKLDLSKSTKSIAKALNEKAVLEKGVNLLICKSTFTLEMHQENIENITYCPLNISIYQYKNINYISYKKYHNFKQEDKIAKRINEELKDLILKSLD